MLRNTETEREPSTTGQLGWTQARTLLTRTRFGANPAEIHAFAQQPLEEVTSQRVAELTYDRTSAPPSWVREPPALPSDKDARSKLMRQQQTELQTWWARELATTDSPFQEWIVLFWHNHFVSDVRRVRRPEDMWNQLELFREHGQRNFRDLLHAVARDAAMIRYLDTDKNIRSHPNENFARELLERFTLGEGHYTETDIKEAARAFTGWRYDRSRARFTITKKQHDNGIKNFMGHRGNLSGDDILDIVLKQDRCAVFIVEKFWRALISPTPIPAMIDKFAATLRGSDYAIQPLISEILNTPGIFGHQHEAQLIKSPVDLVIGTMRTFNVRPQDFAPVVLVMGRMGQDLLKPPNVRGWVGGTAWVDSASIIRRRELLRRFFDGRDASWQVTKSWLRDRGWEIPRNRAAQLQYAASVLLPRPAVHEEPTDPESFRALLRHTVLDPSYQLK